MSLVDELLADFSPSPSPSQSRSASPEPPPTASDQQLIDNVASNGVLAELDSTARLLSQLNPLLDQIDTYTENPDSVSGNVEDNPEYKLLVEVNDLASDITNEVASLHKYIAEKYRPRFPELESLVLNPVEYAKTVKVIGNDISTIKDKQNELAEFLQAAIIMVLAVSALTSSSRPLTDEEFLAANESSELLLFLDSAKRKITQYVSTKLSVFAPNTAALVGSQTAAQLFGAAGGLNGLLKLPACNMPSLGAKRNQTNIGLGNTGIRQQGFLYFCPIIQSTPIDLRRQALRILSGKVALSTRVDLAHTALDGSQGFKMKQEVEDKLEKLGIPPSNKGPKALPAPDDKPSKKRGGKRIRKYKQQFAMTDLRKAQNRMKFGEQDGDYID
ncbi:hypothetical protein V1525DRAFT_448905 [Lipomyces kononenkoae]|uniref:Uncharacterized protein n=1 Tax=Lipomyces kononenkoae TaxID=34357 RepID=A0ACC3T735_LIPKO